MAGVAVLLEILLQNLLRAHVNNCSDCEHRALVLKENHILEFHVVRSVRNLYYYYTQQVCVLAW